jgi:hypothetical protein
MKVITEINILQMDISIKDVNATTRCRNMAEALAAHPIIKSATVN